MILAVSWRLWSVGCVEGSPGLRSRQHPTLSDTGKADRNLTMARHTNAATPNS